MNDKVIGAVVSDQPTPILCPDCGHDIDRHADAWYECRLCGCAVMPSDIARVLLAAEPTETEINAAAKAIFCCDAGADDRAENVWERLPENFRARFHATALTALRAAREAR